jgi:hypothetical protein
MARDAHRTERRLVDIARGETVESDLDRLMERRYSREIDRDEQEELWKASVRACTAHSLIWWRQLPPHYLVKGG